MNHQVHEVIPSHLGTAECVVYGEGKIDERPAFDRDAAVVRRRQWPPDRPEMADRQVLLNRGYVIKDEWARETVVIRQQTGGDHHQRHPLLSFHKSFFSSSLAILPVAVRGKSSMPGISRGIL